MKNITYAVLNGLIISGANTANSSYSSWLRDHKNYDLYYVETEDPTYNNISLLKFEAGEVVPKTEVDLFNEEMVPIIHALERAAFDYVASKYNDIAMMQINRLGTFGNAAQKAEAKKVSDFSDLVTAECFLRINNYINTMVKPSMDFSTLDLEDPEVLISDIMLLT